MLRKTFKPFIWCLTLTLLLANQACGLFAKPTGAAAQPSADIPTAVKSPASTMTPTTTPITSTATPIPTPTAASLPTKMSSVVTITAVNGNLAIRKGPDEVFDAIAALHAGDTAQAVARSVLDGWVEIPIPSRPDEMGWISTRTAYSVVSGNVLDLPMIRTVEWPTGAYLRNCTTHEMLVEPGGTSLPAVGDSPNNRVWFPPGLYSVYDQEVDGHPDVLDVELWPQYSMDVRKDGNGTRAGCP